MTEVNQVKLYKKNSEKINTPKINYNENNVESNTEKRSIENNHQEIRNTKKKKKKPLSSVFKTIIIVSSILIISVIATITIILVKNSKKKIKQNEDDELPTTIINENQKTTINEEHDPLEMQIEYKIKTNKNDLKRIYVNQKYFEEINVGGELRTNLVDRKTNYDIYIIDEFPAPIEDQNFYNKTYLSCKTFTGSRKFRKFSFAIMFFQFNR